MLNIFRFSLAHFTSHIVGIVHYFGVPFVFSTRFNIQVSVIFFQKNQKKNSVVFEWLCLFYFYFQKLKHQQQDTAWLTD